MSAQTTPTRAGRAIRPEDPSLAGGNRLEICSERPNPLPASVGSDQWRSASAYRQAFDNRGSAVGGVSTAGGGMSRRNPISKMLPALFPSAIRARGLALILTTLPGAAEAADKLVLQLHREPQFEF